MKKELYFETIAEKVKLEKIARTLGFIKVKGIWMKISERDLKYVKKHYNIGDFIAIDYTSDDSVHYYDIVKVHKKRKKKTNDNTKQNRTLSRS